MSNDIPKGKLIIIGGGITHNYNWTSRDIELPENMATFETNLFRRILHESKDHLNTRIEIVTTASTIYEEVGKNHKAAFECFGAKNVGVMHILTRDEANSKVFLNRLKRADMVMFTGGNQLRISSIIGGTRFHEILLEKYFNEDFIFVGTSAGAAAASAMMLYGPDDETLVKGMAKLTTGLGLTDKMIIDTHFIQRSRVSRLIHSVVSNPRMLGVGLDEDSGLIITDGNRMEAIGTHKVMIVDARGLKETNLTQVDNGQALSINGLMVHIMSKYDVYYIREKRLDIHNVPYMPHILN